MEEYRAYVALAKSFTQRPAPVLIITHGFSGSGKTTQSQSLLEMIGAVRIRSDVERKRLGGLSAGARTHAGLEDRLYEPDMSDRTYTRLRELARTIIASGYSVIVDATFLKQNQRVGFQSLADELQAPFWIIDFPAEEKLLRERVLMRHESGIDASEADITVLEHQLAHHEPFTDEERARVFTCSMDAMAVCEPAVLWAPLLMRLRDGRF